MKGKMSARDLCFMGLFTAIIAVLAQMGYHSYPTAIHILSKLGG